MVTGPTQTDVGRTETELEAPLVAATPSFILAVDSDETAQSQSQTQSEPSQQVTTGLVSVKGQHLVESSKRKEPVDEADDQTFCRAKQPRLSESPVKSE